MIANMVELRVTTRQLRLMELGLRSLRERLESSNPWLFNITKKAYERRIALLQAEIVQYLAEHPADVSLVLPPLEEVERQLPTTVPSAV